MLITGNLEVGGLLSDCAEAEHTLLVVLGDLQAKNVFVRGELAIAGSLRVQGVVYANSLNDYALTVGKDLSADALIETGMSCHSGVRSAHELCSHFRMKSSRESRQRSSSSVVPFQSTRFSCQKCYETAIQMTVRSSKDFEQGSP